MRMGEEKGIDVRIALDMIRLTYWNEFDVGILFSQDQDLPRPSRKFEKSPKTNAGPLNFFCTSPLAIKRATG